MPTTSKLTSEQVGLVYGFRSGLEGANTAHLQKAGAQFVYEDFKIPYRVEKSCTYMPDIFIRNGIIVETKGRFVTADRQKHLMIAKQYPDLDIRFVFSRSSSKLSKQSRTTYAAWCEKNGFAFADKLIPHAWHREPVNRRSLEAIRAIYSNANRECPF
jgi:hypothetical protein